MKKRIAIFTRALWQNGSTKSLVELLKRVDLVHCAVDIYVLDFSNQTKWIEEIPKEIQIKKVPRYEGVLKIWKNILQHPIHFLRAVYAGRKLRQDISMIQQMRYTALRLPILEEQYDIAISYRHFDIDVFYVINNIRAKKKFFWIHGIQKMNQEEIQELKDVYEKYDGIFPVSVAAMKNIIKFFPNIKQKCKVAYCVVDPSEIIERSMEAERFIGQKWKIFTIGRLAEEKGISFAVKACSILKKQGYSVQWFVAGDGAQRKELEELIKQENVENEFTLLGSIENPYGLLASCDIYVQPSLLESYGLTINEARIFNKPIVCTDIPAGREQIVNNKTGLLVKLDAESIAKGICKYIDNQMFREYICNNLKKDNKSHFEVINVFNNEVLGIVD